MASSVVSPMMTPVHAGNIGFSVVSLSLVVDY